MDKEKAKQKIQKLVEKYEQIVNSGKVNKYSEESTKKDFILPLFEALGWNTYSKEVSAEEGIKSAGRVDYGFYLNERPKFYVEAKPLDANLLDIKYAEQAIKYSWNKSVVWAVLTNFKSIRIFNAQNISEMLGGKLLFEIPYSEYIERFEQLWLLSKESFEKELISKYATEHGKMLQRVSVTSILSKDLSECRDILIDELPKYNEDKNINPDLLDEGVQRLLDRLIFIRVAEDRGIEEKTLEPMLHQWQNSKKEEPLFRSMVARFRELDKTYNSNLFAEHPFEEWEDWNGKATGQVIKKLSGKENYYEYDFKDMPADVLGAVYENYLGHRLSKSKKGLTIDKDAKKRKEQGIYYTPNFIVDYIVRNALKPVLDKCKSINDLKKIKVLDPACGSGSFLIKALEVINEKYKEFKNPGNEFTKISILTENIYGVDLDEQAVEITRLNLLISALDKKMKLPILDHIKHGNSLISGTDQELKKYFGPNFRDKKPFNWQEQFPEVSREGGFDVIIGNPPYIDSEEMTKTQSDFREYCNNVYKSASGNWDLFCLFFERGLNLLKDGGQIGLIVPNKLISAKYAEKTRELINENKIIVIRDYSEIVVFGADVYPIVIIIQKGKPKDNFIKIITNTQKNIKQNILFGYKEGWSPVFAGNFGFEFLDKIIKKSQRLDEIFEVCGAATVGEAYEIKKLIKELYNEKKLF
ncbi:MAG: N-6 DNA methylase [Candidatus Parcubacteria bacterium]|nr:N-6 DNA methylase [Candidatus Parcubacteria bacterium]